MCLSFVLLIACINEPQIHSGVLHLLHHRCLRGMSSDKLKGTGESESSPRIFRKAALYQLCSCNVQCHSQYNFGQFFTNCERQCHS